MLLLTPKTKSPALISAILFDPKTKELIEKIGPRPANTFTQNWIKCLSALLSQVATTGVVDTGGTSRTATAAASLLGLNGGAGNTGTGIVIGTGAGPAAITDTKLATQYTNTTNFTHAINTFSLNTAGAEYQLLIARTFTNSTGSTVSITEVGLYATGSYTFCVDRTMFSVSLGTGQSTTLTYTIQTP